MEIVVFFISDINFKKAISHQITHILKERALRIEQGIVFFDDTRDSLTPFLWLPLSQYGDWATAKKG